MSAAIPASSAGELPVPLTRFIGRTRELADLTHLLSRPDVRLVTVTGPGGVGKTRLMIEAAAAVADQFPDGIAYVSLAAVSEPGLLMPVLAEAFGIQNLDQDGGIDRLNRYLCNRRLLIALDNFEQVIDAAADLADLLGGCPDLTIVVTSRTRMRVSGEHQFPLAPMSDAVSPGGRAGDALPDCVHLFVERAQAIDPGFARTAENAGLIASICRRVDCLPLAIELAAARVNLLPLPALLNRLETTLPILTGGARDLPARQQTMRNAIAWSYDLLSEPEKMVFRRLAVLPSGFSFELLEPDLRLADEDPVDFLEVISSLVDNSLIHRQMGRTGDTRYVMLGTIREFAMEQLATSGEAEETLASVTDQYTEFAIAAQPRLMGREGRQANWLRTIDDEFANFRVVFDYLERTNDIPRLMRLIYSLDWYFTARSAQVDIRRWTDEALAAAGTVDPRILTEALQSLSYTSGIRGEIERSIACAEAAHRIGQNSDDLVAQGLASLTMGLALEFSGDHESALRFYLESVPLFRQAGKPHWLQYALSESGNLLNLGGNPARARPLLEEARILAVETGDLLGLHFTLCEMAHVERSEGNLAGAIALARKSYDLATQVGSIRGELGVICLLAGVALDLGRARDAAQWLGAVDVLKAHVGIERVANSLFANRIAEEVRSHLGDAAFAEDYRQGQAMPWDAVVSGALALPADKPVDPGLTTSNEYGLTPRELDVLQELVAGKSDKEIADRLFIGARTVQTHVANLIAKLNVSNRTEAAAVAVRDMLLQPRGNYGDRLP